MFRSVQERRRNRARKRLTFELLESRRLLAAVDWTGNAGNGLWSDPANWSSAAVPDFDDDVTINVAGNATVVLQGVQSVRSFVNHETLVLQGNNTQGAAVLQVSESSANSGVVELVSLSSNGNYGARLNINDDALFTNQAGAELRVLAGSGSYRQLGGNGDFINDGFIEIETGIHLRSVMVDTGQTRESSSHKHRRRLRSGSSRKRE